MKINTIPSIASRLAAGAYVRSLHYHNTPLPHRERYQRQLAWVAERYSAIRPADLAARFAGDRFLTPKPPLLVGLFDGYRNNAHVMAPLLGEQGLAGWFLLVADFLNTPPGEQRAMLEPYSMQWLEGEYPDGRYAMTWDQAAAIARDHTIVNHTSTHYQLGENTPPETLAYETQHAQELIAGHCGCSPQAFSWLGGAWYAQHPQAGEQLGRLGFRYLLGYFLEDITPDTAGDGIAVPEDCGPPPSPGELSADLLRAFREHMARRTIFDAVPAILPLHRPLGTIRSGGGAADRQLAGEFLTYANHFTGEMDEWQAACTALELLAFATIGDGFPH